jgi:hypothetical protein
MKYLFIVAVVTVLTVTSTGFSQTRVHPAFIALTASQVRSEFDSYEEKGKRCAQDQARGRRCAPVSFSPEQPFNIPVQTDRGQQFLTFRASIDTPRSEVRLLAYQFGKVWRSRTAADRNDVLNRLIARMQNSPQAVAVTLKLISRRDWSTPVPELSFALVNEAGGKLWSSSRPDFECGEVDLICQVALSQSGASVTFPLFTSPNNVPFVNETMSRLTLIVTVDGQDEPVVFDLTGLSP